jgi:pimeloyl-ACP methyl ester carboxylesterase
MAATTETIELARPGDPTRARYPDAEGFVERDGVRIFYEVYGDREPTLQLIPAWAIVHSRIWKAHIAYLARHFRVITHDPRGNGRSDRPQNPAAYALRETAEDAIAVMDATETPSAIPVAMSAGTLEALYLASRHPERVDAAAFIGPLFPVTEEWPAWTRSSLFERRESYEGAERYNVHYIREHFPEFVEWWARECCGEPHSTMAIEYAVQWGLETDGATLAHTLGMAEELGVECMAELFEAGRPAFLEMARSIDCPVLVLEGELDTVTPQSWAKALAKETGGRYVPLADTAHTLGRKPVPINLALRELAEAVRRR